VPVKPIHNDRELFNLIAGGDERAFKQLYYEYLPRIQPLIAAIIRLDAPVKDIVQEIFLRIWLNREKLTEIQDPKAWIFKIAYFQSFTWLRRQTVKQRSREVLVAQASNNTGNPVEEYTSVQEIGRLVRQAILSLAPREQLIYQLSREEHLKIQEIANRLEISPNTVKNTLVRALKKIRKALEEKGVFLPAVLLWYYLV